MRQWLFEKAELADSPSRRDGIDAATEARYRREGTRFILEAGNDLSLKPNPTLATACVYFHRFYTAHSFKEYHRYLTAAAAIFLAGKVEETPKKCRDLVEATVAKLSSPRLSKSALAAFTKDPNADLTQPHVVQAMKEEVMSVERVLLQTIKFDLQVVHPYQFLLQYAKIFKVDQEQKNKMVQMAWIFLNDSLSTTLCLQWEPEVIAIALIYLSARLSKMDQRDFEGRQGRGMQWWDLYVSDMPTKLLEEICHMVLDLYSGSKSKPGAPPPPPPPATSARTPSTSTPATPTAAPSTPGTPLVGAFTHPAYPPPPIAHQPGQSLGMYYPPAGAGAMVYQAQTSFPPPPAFPPAPPPAQPPPPPAPDSAALSLSDYVVARERS